MADVNKGVEMGKAAIAVGGGVALALILLGIALQMFGGGVASFVNNVGTSLQINSTFALLLVIAALGLSAGLLIAGVMAVLRS